MICTGSPGVSVIMMKAMRLTPRRTGRSCKSRSSSFPMLMSVPREEALVDAGVVEVDTAVGARFPALQTLGDTIDVLRHPEVDVGCVGVDHQLGFAIHARPLLDVELDRGRVEDRVELRIGVARGVAAIVGAVRRREDVERIERAVAP